MENIADTVLDRKAVESRKERVILRDVLIYHSGAQKGHLDVSHSLPVNDDVMKFNIQFLTEQLDVLNGKIGVPPRVNVNCERMQSPFPYLV